MTALTVDIVAEHADGFRLEIAFEIPAGITILFGPSGAGKSTALQSIAGLLKPRSGIVRVGGDVWFDAAHSIDLKVEARKVAYVFQSLALFRHLTALDNVAYGIVGDRDNRRERAKAWLDRLHVSHLAERKPATFSGGEAQRVALARALAIGPRVVLFDEAFSALDPALRRDLAVEIRDFVRELGVPALVVTHDVDEARALGDRAIRIEHGRIAATGAVDDLV